MTAKSVPPWMSSVLEQLQELLLLEHNWDSYGAPRIKLSTTLAVVEWLAQSAFETPAPALVPTSQGGIQLEWHERGVDLEIEFISAREVYIYFADLASGKEWAHFFASSLAREGV